MRQPGPLIASGRDADIFEYGPGLVLRRSRRGRTMAPEARVMELVRDHGYPVPAVEEVSEDGLDIVMQRIDGVLMMDVLGARPWTLRSHADTLADLLQRLGRIEAPDWLGAAPGAPGDRVVHMDLHPLNVMLTKEVPVVIDWAGASRGDPSTDVVLTWVLIASGEVDAGRLMRIAGKAGRALFTRRFLSHFDLASVLPHLAGVVDWKLLDPNMSRAEQEAMRALVHAGA